MGGPLEVMELLTPIMSVTTMVLSLAWEHPWAVLPSSPYFARAVDFLVTLLIIFVGALLAFLMVSVPHAEELCTGPACWTGELR
jgi:solute carrier family 35, member C2